MSNVVETRFNQAALTRLAKQYGPQMVDLFLQLEKVMVSQGSTSLMVNTSFIEPGEPVRDGELIPTLHFNITPNFPALSFPLEVEEIDDARSDNTIRDGTDREQ